MHGCSNLKLLKSYLTELMWIDRYGDDAINLCYHMLFNILLNYNHNNFCLFKNVL